MESYHPPATKRLGTPDLLDWEAGDKKRARLGLGVESFDLAQSSENPNNQTQRTDLGCAFGSPSLVLEDCSEPPDVWMSDAHAPWGDQDQFVGLDPNSQLSEPPVGMVCFGMICDSKGLLLDDPTAVEKSGLLSLPARRDTYELRPVSRDNVTFLQLDSDTEADVAVLDQITAHALSAVSKVFGCQVDLFLSGTEFQNLRSKFKSGEKRSNLLLRLCFTGPRKQRARLDGFSPKPDFIFRIRHTNAMEYRDTTTLTE
ncbi:hypothetical protein B0T26DRAFT_310514 [Lasiosphaeria miniovina]|uniref:Uncharacterized protein n=1 Tax=Lasiosphaeria miniovina TaxID=1954250 RepID=A0AA40ALE5_9PEZI|nr:uncharacterized protein B0T26DRAFT_310514 [Lasiosphaeria miniovina]KAK0718015.1 hypothetical protein B0T26DRAFT_310514 [Lasiosphaeria miniovina]